MNLLPQFATRRTDDDIEHLIDQIHHTDALDLLRRLPDGSIDMVLCDLPYGVTACKWDTVIPIEPMWEQLKRIVKPRSAIVLTATQPFTSRLVSSNYEMFKYEWVWVKTSPSDHIRAKIKPMTKHENVLVFSKGTVANASPLIMNYYPQGTKKANEKHYRPTLFSGKNRVISRRPSHKNEWIRTTVNYPDTVLEIANPNNHNIHPTQKPVALFEYLIKTYTREGEFVLDMTCGSGTTAVAARKTGRRFICGDITQEYVDIARKRLQDTDPYQPTVHEDGTKQLSLFEGLSA